jgi:hypothetical protein
MMEWPVLTLPDPRRMTCLEAHCDQVANFGPIPGGSCIYQTDQVTGRFPTGPDGLKASMPALP